MVKGRDDDVTWPVRGFNGYCPGNISKAEHLEKYGFKIDGEKNDCGAKLFKVVCLNGHVSWKLFEEIQKGFRCCNG